MLEDFAIVKLILGGDINSYELLVEKYKGQVFKIVNAHVPYSDADEVSHLVFVKAYQALSTFRGDAPLAHWFSKIAVRTCYDFWRAKKREKEVFLESEKFNFVDAEQSYRAFYEGLSDSQAKEILDLGMSKLSADDRMLVGLHHLEGYSEKETAELLGWSVAKVKFRAFQSRRTLAKVLNKFFVKQD